MNKQTFSAVSQNRKTYQKYDDQHIIAYMNEEVLKDYTPEDESEEGEPVVWPVAYRYTGTERDGGTVLPCTNLNDYGDVANAIIRSRYSESQELAIHRHAQNGDYEENPTEYEEYNAFCEFAVTQAKAWVLGQ